MADIVLINPYIGGLLPRNVPEIEKIRFKIPWGIFSIGSVLDNEGYDVKIIDAHAYYSMKNIIYFKNLIRREIKNAIYVGFSVMSAGIKHGLELTKYVKEEKPNIPVVWGGHHPMLFPKQCCQDPLIDYVVMYEGERTALELAKILKENGDVSNIKGIAYKKGTKVMINPPREPIDLNELPDPAWHLLDMKLYLEGPYSPLYPPGQIIKTLQLYTGAGCSYKCAFCINSILPHITKWRPKSANKILNELEYMVNEYNLDYVWFLDENFFGNKKRLLDIFKGLKKRRIDVDWGANCRADYFSQKYLGGPLIKDVKAIKCKFIAFGAESGSNKILESIQKGITTEDILNSAKICNKYDITPNYSFMIGIPGETKFDINKTLDLINKIKKVCPKATFNGPQTFRPYPGSRLYEECRKMGLHEPLTLREWIKEDKCESTQHIGYLSLKDFTWIANPRYVYFIDGYYCSCVLPSIKQFIDDNSSLKLSKALAIVLIKKLRWKLKFFGLFGVEEQLYNKLMKTKPMEVAKIEVLKT